jgi:G:T-mismatch repair DNA endonuclease (very short patch repair protein)
VYTFNRDRQLSTGYPQERDMPRHATKTSFVKGDIRLVGIKRSIEYLKKCSLKLRKRIPVICDNCNKILEVVPYVKKHQKYHFCNKICYMEWNHRIGYEIRPFNLTKKGRKILEKIWSKNGYKLWFKKTKEEKTQWNKKMRSFQAIRPTKPEKILKDIIDRNKLEYKYTGDGKFWIANINPDFINCNGKKIVLEVFGDYWHNLDKVKIRDEKKLITFKKYGWNRIVLWEKEIYNLSEQEIVNKIEEASHSSA